MLSALLVALGTVVFSWSVRAFAISNVMLALACLALVAVIVREGRSTGKGSAAKAPAASAPSNSEPEAAGA